MNPAGISILVLVLAVGIGLVAWAAVTGMQGCRGSGGDAPERPGNGQGRRVSAPSPWIVVTIVVLLLGVVVAPRLLGVTFVFLPLLWMHRRRGPGPWPGRGPE